MATPHAKVRVDLGTRGYDIHIGGGILGQLPAIIKGTGVPPPPARVVVIADRGIPAAVVSSLQSQLRDSGLNPLILSVAPSEHTKSLASLTELLVEMTRNRLERTDAVVALGGGIVGDLAGFAAAIYRRGMPVFQCPTTLLAMVDASVGGKTGVNLATGPGPGHLKKNMLGAFHQPRSVIADTSTLSSLPDRHLRAGLAECIKHGMLAADWTDPQLLTWTGDNLAVILSRDHPTLVELVARNTRIKAAIVGRDEREDDASGARMTLNLGHTFAHAIETLPGVSVGAPDGILHGEAVALGLVAAAQTAAALGRIQPAYAAQVATLLTSAGLPTVARGLPPDDQFLALMAHDKKTAQGRLRLVLPCAPSRVSVFDDPPAAAILQGLRAIRA